MSFRDTQIVTKEKTHPLTPTTPLAKGTAVDIKVFPPSKPGKTDFVTPDLPAAPSDFDTQVDHYVRLIGSSIERLNGLQFDLDNDKNQNPNNPNSELAKFNKAFSDFAKDLNPPPQHPLVWPLDGLYVCQPADVVPNPTFRRFGLSICFEKDPDWLMVTNCTVVATAERQLPSDLSTASVLATSSGP